LGKNFPGKLANSWPDPEGREPLAPDSSPVFVLSRRGHKELKNSVRELKSLIAFRNRSRRPKSYLNFDGLKQCRRVDASEDHRTRLEGLRPFDGVS